MDLIQTLLVSVAKSSSEAQSANSGLVSRALSQFLTFEKGLASGLETNSSVDHARFSHAETGLLSQSERNELLAEIESSILAGGFKVSGPHRKPDWEAGWGENLAELASANGAEVTSKILPKYFGKSKYLRIGGVHVSSNSSDLLEAELLSVLVDALVSYLDKAYSATALYEFGCGTGHHLIRLRRIMSGKKLVGLDWAESSQGILNEVSKRLDDPLLVGENFNFFSPNDKLVVSDKSLFLTVASLEQVGRNFGPFLDFVLKSKPSVVVHVEPIEELLGESKEEQLSKLYFKKRGYLSGYLSELRKLETEGQLRILAAERTGLGSLYIEGYSVIVWEVVQGK
jgi:hypothetical protein